MTTSNGPQPCSSIPDEILEELILNATAISGEMETIQPRKEPDTLFIEIDEMDWKVERLARDWEDALPTRHALTLVSRRWNRIASPILYSSFCFRSQTDVTKVLQKISEKPALGRFVKRILSVPPEFGERNRPGLSKLMVYCPNLITLDTYTQVDVEAIPSGIRNLSIVERADADTRNILLRLKNLEWIYLGASSSVHSTLYRYSKDTSLQLYLTQDGERRQSGGYRRPLIPNDTLPRPILAPVSTILTHLSTSIQWLNLYLIGEPLSLPRLQHLHLSLVRNGVVDSIRMLSCPALITFSMTLGYSGFSNNAAALVQYIIQHAASRLRFLVTASPRDIPLSWKSFVGTQQEQIKEVIATAERAEVEWRGYVGGELVHIRSLLGQI